MALLAVVLPSAAQTKLNGAGATFPYPIYSKWFNQYHQEHPEIEINYQSIGSGGGIAQVTAGTVDFGASPSFTFRLFSAQLCLLTTFLALKPN